MHLLRVGWRNLFFSCDVMLYQFSVLVGNRFLVLHTTYVLKVPYSCGVVLFFFNLVGNSLPGGTRQGAASTTRINLEEPVRVRPAQPG